MITIAFVDTLGLCYDGDTLNRRGLGGSESAVISMSRELVKLGFSVYVFNDCTSDDCQPGVYDGVAYHPLKDLECFSGFDVFIASRSVVSFVPDKTKHQFKWSANLPDIERVSMSSRSRVLWLHDTFCDGDDQIESLVLQGRIHKIFTLSDWHTTYVTNCYHGKRRHYETLKPHIFQTRNGINQYLEPDISKKDPDLFVYNASVSKGMVPLVEKIWPAFVKNHPSAKLTIIGGYYKFREHHGPDEQELKYRELVKNHPEINFTGVIPQEEVAKIVARASFMVYPSAFPETFGISTLESLAYYTPVITCRNGALEETALDIACYKMPYPVEPNVLFTEISSEEQCKRFVALMESAYTNRYLHQQKMYACRQITDICPWNTVALQWKQQLVNQLGGYLNVLEHRHANLITQRVKEVFGRTWTNPTEQRQSYPSRYQPADLAVIIPAFNAANYIGRCLESVFAQDYDNYHVFIINDASTDQTAEVIQDALKRFGPDHITVTVITNQHNRGAVYNQVRTIKKFLHGHETVVLIDGDDWLPTDPYIFSKINHLYQQGADFTYGSCWSVADQIPLIAQPYPKDVIKAKTFREHKFNWGMPYTHLRTFCADLIKGAADSNFQDEHGRWYGPGGDNSVFYTAIESAKNIVCIPDIMYCYNDLNPINDYKVNQHEQTVTAQEITNKKHKQNQDNGPLMQKVFEELCTVPSDIYEHLPTLRKYADMSSVVVELGVREGTSTSAFLSADCDLHSYDLYRSAKVQSWFDSTTITDPHRNISYSIGDSRTITIPECDTLFIDTDHTYTQLKTELTQHHRQVRSFIILHDTVTFADMVPAVHEFLADNPDWFVLEEFVNNNGLTVLARKSALYTVIIPTMWRCSHVTTLMLELLHEHPLVHEVIVYDNDVSVRAIDYDVKTGLDPRYSKKIRFVSHDKNQYVNPCWNFGAEQATTNRLCFLNDDVYVNTQVFNRLFKHITNTHGVFGLLTGEEKFGHPKYQDGSVRIMPWQQGDNIHGFGQLMFIAKDNWVPIIHGLDIYFGDDFIFRNQLMAGRTNFLIYDVEWWSPMAATTKDPLLVGGFFEREAKIYSAWEQSALNKPPATQTDVPTQKVSQPKKILLAIPTQKYIEPETFKSIYDLVIPKGYTVDFQFFYGYQIDQVRNLIAEWSKKYDYLFSVDSDITFTPDTLVRLLAANKPIVSGLYRQRVGDVILEAYDTEYRNIPADRLPQQQLVEVGAVGFGCVLVKSEVISSMPYPHFVYRSALNHKDTLSEDVYFCQQARQLGFSVWIDTNILCGHKGTTWFNLYPSKTN